MAGISIELIARSEASLREDLGILKEHFNCVDLINIPELLRYDLHSWEGASVAQQFAYRAVPHIRAIDIDLDEPLPMADYLTERNVREVLVITGDPPQDMSRKIYPTVSTDVIRKFREELPDIKVYAGIDQYRGSMRQEAYQIRRKLQAGAAGFFTQPFFDLRYMEMYAEMLDGVEVYWGVAPVMSERSVNYWETKNNVIFPRGFQPTLEWNIAFAKGAFQFAEENDANLYIMPIKTNLLAYLEGALGQSTA